MKLKMRDTLLLTMLPLTVIPILVLAVLGIIFLNKDAMNDAKKYLEVIEYSLYEHHQMHKEVLTRYIDELSKDISNSYPITEQNRTTIINKLKTFKDSNNLDMMILMDQNKIVQARSNSDLYGDKFSDIKIIDKSIQGNTIVSIDVLPDIVLQKEGSKLFKEIESHPIYYDYSKELNKKQSPKAVFWVAAAPVKKIINNKEETIGVVWGGKLLYSDFFKRLSRKMRIVDTNIAVQTLDVPFKKAPNVDVIPMYNFEGKPVANLIVWFDLNLINDLLHDQKDLYFYAFIATGLIASIAAFIGSKLLVNPLVALDSATKEVANQNFDVSVNVKGPLEIEHLSTAFNRMTDALSEKRQMQDDFIAMLTHDMRVPIVAEQKALELITSDSRFELSKDQMTLIQNMITSNADLLRLVNTLLDTYKLEAGKFTLTLSKNNIIDTVKYIVDEGRPMFIDHNQTVELITESDSIILNYDVSEMKRVLRNVMSNAVKFTPDGGNITANVYTKESDVVIAVKDSGCGMTQEQINNIFNRYYSTAKKQKKIGTGLGLYLSYQIVLAHKGNMCVESELNKGSTFYVTLPKNI